MMTSAGARPDRPGQLLSSFEEQFSALDARSRQLLAQLTPGQLFQNPRELGGHTAMFSCGECLVRSAAEVEKTFGGITTRLWDDPFEWTLPEKLSDKRMITQYFDEVRSTRAKGFGFFSSDHDLGMRIPAPEKLRPLFDILVDTLVMASHYQGRAFAVYQMISDGKLPRLY
jgi:hypothetical protein